MTNTAMSVDFLSAFARLPGAQQRSVRSLIARFSNNPTASGLNYERIHGAKDPNMRSLRIDGSYRAIVLKPARGDIHMLLWADKHDDAYHWATRRRCDVNPETGALQVYAPQDDGPAEAPQAAIEPAGAFADLKDRELVRLGVPAAMLPEVRGIADEDAFESIEQRLPEEAYEALFYYLAGESYEDLVREREAPPKVDVADFNAALQRPESQMRFAVAADDMELEAMLNAPLERWRVFLHPSQRRLVERDWNGPVRLLGGAGTGKTVVAMHRARWLARNLPQGRILFTTFTRNLAADIEHNLRTICTPDEMQRIEVTNLDRWVVRFLRQRRYQFQLQFGGRHEDAWRIALDARPPTLDLPDAFYEDEWEQVIQAGAVADKQAYLIVSRAGRGTRLTRTERALIWPVFEEYRAQLAERGVKEVDDTYRDATALQAAEPPALDGTGYAAVIVDEAQDMGAPAFRLLCAIAPPGRNNLFITGDGHQRIYSRRRVVLSRCGIDIRGRSRKLRLNYRTTEQTRRWAAALLAGRHIDDLDNGTDDSYGIRSLTRGPQPQLAHFDTREEHDAHLLACIGKLVDDGAARRGICVVARTSAERDAAAEALRGGGHECVVLGGNTDDDNRGDAVRVATMHRVKGLEFDHMLLASVNDGIVPRRFAAEAADATAKENAETEERALLHVAATRARKSLSVLSFGVPSTFLQDQST